MPPERVQIGRKSVEQEGRALLAIQAIQNKEISSIREAARRFNVPQTTLRRRLTGHTFRAETRANSHKLTQIDEESLKQWILSMDQRGASPRPTTIQEIANILLTAQGSDQVGKNWVSNFI